MDFENNTLERRLCLRTDPWVKDGNGHRGTGPTALSLRPQLSVTQQEDSTLGPHSARCPWGIWSAHFSLLLCISKTLPEAPSAQCMCAPSRSRVRLFETPWTVALQAPLSMGFSRQEYWSGLHFLLQGILLTQGSLRFLHWQAGSLPLSHL